jgi:hypothetical protein
MSLRFDATLKDLVQRFLHDYEVQMGLSDLGPFTPLNVDLSTVTAATDIALGHGDPPGRVVDINFQSGPDEELQARVLLYHALLHFRYRVPVHSVVVLLRPLADRRQLTGKLRYVGRHRKGRMNFSYEIIRSGAGGGRAAVSGSACHERIIDVPGYSCRGTNRGTN